MLRKEQNGCSVIQRTGDHFKDEICSPQPLKSGSWRNCESLVQLAVFAAQTAVLDVSAARKSCFHFKLIEKPFDWFCRAPSVCVVIFCFFSLVDPSMSIILDLLPIYVNNLGSVRSEVIKGETAKPD